MLTAATSIEEIQEMVRRTPPGTRLLPVAGATKPALSQPDQEDVERLDVSELRGVLEYDPAELTMTALAGTPVRDLQRALSEHGQYLPFDPPLASAGATLGGVVASGASGPRALRHGGVRDFVIGVRFVAGTGEVVTGGGKVVKNAAGFDLPKLMVGSLGRLGVIVQLSVKVFPQPPATTTLEFTFGDIESAVTAVTALMRSPVELDSLDIAPGARVLARIAGRPEALDSRAARLAGAVDAQAVRHEGADEQALWEAATELTWVSHGSTVVRVGLSIRQVAALDQALSGTRGAHSRYSIGGTTAWISWPAAAPLEDLDRILHGLGLAGVVLVGAPGRSRLGPATGGVFATRVTRALDPHQRFLEL